jgi:hypothetical protein
MELDALTAGFVRAALFIAEAEEDCLDLVQRPILIRPFRLDNDTSPAIKVRAQNFEDARGGITFLVLADRDLTLESDRTLNKFRRRARVQPKLINDLEFSLHAKKKSLSKGRLIGGNGKTFATCGRSI